MKRNAVRVLEEWKNSAERKPLYLTGIRGVGKTYLAYDFANNFFDSYLYINFEHNKERVEYFESLSEDEIIPALTQYFEIPEELLYTTPFIFDEISICPGFMQHLWNIIRERSHLYWIFISSYDVLKTEIKEQMFCYTLYPVQFDEFLVAIGKEWYVEVIQAHFKSQKKIPDIVHQELLSTFDEYLWIGGMPDVINEYLSMESSINAPERQFIHKELLYHDILKYPGEKSGYKCYQIFSTIEEQLKKPNQRFQFNLIRKGTTYQMYRDALDFLTKHQILYRMDHLEKEQQFKLYYADFSMLSSQRSDELTAVEYQIRLQNYLVQTFSQNGIDCCFWDSKSQASLDFIIKSAGNYIPLELKAEGKSKSKSIHSFALQYPVKKSIRLSSSNFSENEGVHFLPIYAIFCFKTGLTTSF